MVLPSDAYWSLNVGHIVPHYDCEGVSVARDKVIAHCNGVLEENLPHSLTLTVNLATHENPSLNPYMHHCRAVQHSFSLAMGSCTSAVKQHIACSSTNSSWF